jgi:hypothetical protein
MIIVYDSETGDLVRAIEGELVNFDTYQADGYMIKDPGGKYPLPDEGGLFALDETAQPILCESVLESIHNDTGEYYVDTETDELVEVA